MELVNLVSTLWSVVSLSCPVLSTSTSTGNPYTAPFTWALALALSYNPPNEASQVSGRVDRAHLQRHCVVGRVYQPEAWVVANLYFDMFCRPPTTLVSHPRTYHLTPDSFSQVLIDETRSSFVSWSLWLVLPCHVSARSSHQHFPLLS